MQKNPANTSLIIENKNQKPINVDVSVGIPHRVSQNSWACTASIYPLPIRIPVHTGENPLQALSLAVSSVMNALQEIINKEGKVLLPNGEAFSFDAYQIQSLGSKIESKDPKPTSNKKVTA